MSQSKLTKAARGQECTIQLHPYCNGNPETTVLAHIKSDRKGMGIKSPDFFGVFACSDCHDIIDMRRFVEIENEEIQKCILRALFRTWSKLIEMRLVRVES